MPHFDFQGKSIYYETHGEGEPLLLLNGIMMSCRSWGEFIEPLSTGNRLILVDMLDQGQSEKMDDSFTQEIQVQVVKALLDHLGIARTHLMGISYGGEVALQFAIRYGGMVERLVLFNTTARTSPWLRDIGDAWNAASHDGEAYYNTTIPVIYSPAFYSARYDWMQRRREVLVPIFNDAAFAGAMVRLTNSAAHYDVLAELPKIACPTLVVSGELDYITPVEEQKLLCAGIPDCSHVILPGCGHASMYERPMLFASLLIGFVRNAKSRYQI